MRTMVPAGALLYEAKKEKKSQVEGWPLRAWVRLLVKHHPWPKGPGVVGIVTAKTFYHILQ